jgi:hypothetical protein
MQSTPLFSLVEDRASAARVIFYENAPEAMQAGQGSDRTPLPKRNVAKRRTRQAGIAVVHIVFQRALSAHHVETRGIENNVT